MSNWIRFFDGTGPSLAIEDAVSFRQSHQHGLAVEHDVLKSWACMFNHDIYIYTKSLSLYV